jgi:hypothetical protein
MAGRLRERLTIADPAHGVWITIHLVERIEVFDDPATAKEPCCPKER